MPATIIGVDPHKRSHTAVVLDEGERIVSQLRVDAGPGQVDKLLGWAPGGERVWAVENANGLGRLLAQQLVARGEIVVDVPATLSCRARKLSGHSGRKTDEFDARSVVIAAAHNNRLRHVTRGQQHRRDRSVVGPPLAAGVAAATHDLSAARPAR
ncbi:MAG: IS110 family transposase [Actinomycetota bacterium]|nr:IS110 family transposase [Actinomycetota bacterium]